MIRYCSVLVLIGMMATTGNSANVLVYPAYGGSHVIYFGELAKALQSRGFNVTVMTSSRLKLPTSVTEIGVQWWKYPSNIDEKLEQTNTRRVVETMYEGNYIEKIRALLIQRDLFEKEEEALYSHEDVINKIKKGNFDFIVIDISMPVQYVLPYILNKPFAYFAVACDPLGAKEPGSASYVSHPLGPYSDRMTLLERANNLLITVAIRLIMAISGHKTDLCDRYAPEKPALTAMELPARADLCFRLKDPMVETARPSNPNMINIGSIMGRPGRPLDLEKLEKIVTDAKYGVVLVSFGTTYSAMPSYIVDKFLMVLGSLKETVVWKYSEILPNLPKNIIMLPWIPQNDLLAHDNVRLFVTHFGINGFIETVYHGVPIVGFPIGADQVGNGKVAEARGYGRVLDILSFTVGELQEAVQDVLGNNTYIINIRKASDIMRSMPSGGDTAAFWIDHVIKHGSKHLRPHAQDMIWYKYLMLDVYFVFALSLWVIVKFSKLVWSSLCRESKTKID